ncbi:SAM-dependent methyltransferase [Burkholderiales bacterium 8X]|nr:SAM-dependent methyltransferase [Burkholderiales bacterium 8X]
MTAGSTGARADRLRYFDEMYAADPDPYGLRDRWYEARKRAVLMAALPNERYASAYEPGCGSGELSVQLAARCDRLLSSDFSEGALASARERARGLDNVRFERHRLPRDWPSASAPFDLIVLSEVGYFLDADAMQQVATHCAASLADGGVLVACDWRPDFAERALPTAEVHDLLDRLPLTRLVRHEESDFLLEVWCRDGRSVAERERIR